MSTHIELVEECLDVVYRGGVEYMCACPFCGGKSSLQFNIEKGLWVCFKCGERGHAKKLAELCDKNWLEPTIDIDDLAKKLSTIDYVERADGGLPTMPLADSYLRRFGNPHRIHTYWRHQRGFKPATCERWELGYDPFGNRVTMPLRTTFKKELNGIIYRTLDENDPVKYRNPEGFQKSRYLYGSWLCTAEETNSIALVEGPGDTINVDQAGVNVLGQYGSSLSVQQVQLLHQLGIKNVCLFYDYDEAGFKATQHSLGMLHEFTVTQVRWSRNTWCYKDKTQCSCHKIHKPDPGMLGGKIIREMVKNAV